MRGSQNDLLLITHLRCDGPRVGVSPPHPPCNCSSGLASLVYTLNRLVRMAMRTQPPRVCCARQSKELRKFFCALAGQNAFQRTWEGNVQHALCRVPPTALCPLEPCSRWPAFRFDTACVCRHGRTSMSACWLLLCCVCTHVYICLFSICEACRHPTLPCAPRCDLCGAPKVPISIFNERSHSSFSTIHS
jgi:hypothetical protein